MVGSREHRAGRIYASMHTPDPSGLSVALADDSRLAILVLLAAEGPLCVCELIHALAAPQPRVSQHLARLRGAGLVAHRRVANRHYYALAADLPDWVARVVDAYRDGFAETGRLDALRARLATMPDRPPRLEAA